MYQLCIDKEVVKDYITIINTVTGPVRDKDVRPDSLNDILYLLIRQHGKSVHIDSPEIGVKHLPINMLVSVRTDLSNEIMIYNHKFYCDCTASYPNHHPIDDTVMLAGKMLVDKSFDCGDNLVEVIKRTSIYPVGACLIDGKVYVYVMVVIDHKLKDDPIFKIKDSYFEKIPYVKAIFPTLNSVSKELKESLVIVKGDKSNV